MSLFCYALSAQAPSKKFGDISEEDLQMTVYPKDSSAAAVILLDYGELEVNDPYYADLGYKFYHLRRIKILNKSAFSEGDIAIPFKHHEDEELVKNIRAYVYTPDGEKYKLKKSAIFEEKVNKYYSRISFALPNLTEGSIIEYEYELYSDAVFTLRPWYFQQALPVRYSEYKVANQSYFTYTMISTGLPNKEIIELDENTTEYRDGDLSITMGPALYTMKNAPAMVEEPYITTMDDYRTNIRFQLKDYSLPGKPKVEVYTTWENAAKRYEKEFVKPHEKKAKKLIKVLQPQLDQASTPLEKAQILYNFLVEKYIWNYESGITSEATVEDILDGKPVNYAAVTLSFIAGLRELDIPASPILCSTRSNGKAYPSYPIMTQFDHVLAMIELGENAVFIDLYEPYLPFGYIRPDALNQIGFLAKEDNPIWVDIIPQAGSELIGSDLAVSPDGSVEAKLVFRSTGMDGFYERSLHYQDSTGAYWNERSSWMMEDFDILDLKTSGLEPPAKPLTTRMNVIAPEAATVIDDYIYLSPFLYTAFAENPFKIADRNFPVDFPFPFDQRQIIKIKIPEGYQVEELPEKAMVKLNNDAASFLFNTKEQEGFIQLMCELDINQIIFYPEQYSAVKQMFEQVAEKIGEQIVFKKIEK